MGRRSLVRPQAIVVLFVAILLLSRGEVRFIGDDAVEEASSRPLMAIAPTPTVPPTVAAEVTPAPTEAPAARQAPTPTPTAPPTVAPSPTQAPTPSPEPVPTQRPAAPPSGDDTYAVVVDDPQTGRQEIALTFDAGDGRGHTEAILDILAESGVIATFGVTGEWAKANPDMVQRMVAEGHQVMNHGYSHRSMTGSATGEPPMTEAEVRAEVLDTEQAIWEIAGYEVGPYFRFPYGDYDAGILAILKQIGYDYTIWWGCDSKAWMGYTAADIVQECGRDLIAPGLIVLLHVDPDSDVGALPELIEIYRSAGYQLVTVEQLIQP